MENFQSPWAITLLKVSKHFQNLKMFGFILSLYISRGREIVIASYWYSFCLFFFLDCSRKKIGLRTPPPSKIDTCTLKLNLIKEVQYNINEQKFELITPF